MDALLYKPIYLTVVGLLSALAGLNLMSTSGNTLSDGDKRNGNLIVPLILCTIFVFWIGNRPSSWIFGDSNLYAHIYENFAETAEANIHWGAEWFWALLITVCHRSGLDVHVFFTIVAAGYTYSALWAVKKINPSSPYISMLFVAGSLMFFAFSTNGLRNGLACHMVLLAMAFLMDDKRIIAIIIALLAFGTHRSVILPIAATVAAITCIRKPQIAIYIWIGSIFCSLLFGNIFTNFVMSLGFDERMSQYASGELGHDDKFSATGFRWDFLLYSAAPVFLIWYVTIKKNLRDGWFNVISITYLLANAFWVLIIRTEYTNRFAYLSWFLYPIVVSYPLLNMKVWENQNLVAGQVLIAYVSFSIIMITFFWG